MRLLTDGDSTAPRGLPFTTSLHSDNARASRRRIITVAGALLLGTIFPPRCLSCDAFLPMDHAWLRTCDPSAHDRAWFCAHCLGRLTPISRPRCTLCALPRRGMVSELGGEERCEPCQLQPPPWGAARAVYEFGGAARDAMMTLKRSPSAAQGLATRLAETLRREPLETDTLLNARVVSIPLDPRQRARRGFDQAALLASHVRRLLRLGRAPGNLRRQRDAPAQHTLSRAQRLTNLEGVFVWRGEPLNGLRVILIDDVMTTGATFREATRALQDAGAQVIAVAAVSRAT